MAPAELIEAIGTERGGSERPNSIAIQAMFAYNMMVTTIRFITQELDGFASRFANQVEHVYVAHRPLAEEIREANEVLAGKIVGAIRSGGEAAGAIQYPAATKTHQALETSAGRGTTLVQS